MKFPSLHEITRRRAPSGGPVAWLVLALLLLSLLSPMTAAAQDGTPAAAPTEAEGIGIESLDTGSVSVTARACRNGVDPAATYADLDAACTIAVRGWDVSLLDLNGLRTTTLDGSGSGSFADVALLADGSFGLGLPMSGPDIEEVVYCTEASAGAFAPVTDSAGDIAYFPSVASGFDVTCAYFLIAPPKGPGDLVVQLKTCPVAFDLATDSLLDCTSLTDGVSFTLTGGGVTQTGSTGDDAPGRTRFEALAPGEYQVTQAPPSGTASTFVWGCFVLDGVSVAPSEPLSIGSVLTYTMDPGESYLCEWYVVPGDDGATGDGTGTVRLSKYTCPAGTARGDDDYALSEACREEIAPVSFEVSDSAGADVPVTLNPGVPQSGEVSGIAYGTVWIGEIVPDGYGEPLVFCSDTPADGAGNYEQVPVQGGNAVEVELRADAGMPLTCLFFNFADGGDSDDGGDVHLSKYTCPVGVARSDDDYLLSEQCREEIDPVSFTVIATAGGYEASVTAEPGVPQSATFADVPYGDIAIEEAVPAGFGHPLVFCADTAADGPGAYHPVAPWPESGAFIVEHRADAEIDLSCVVFNFPDEEPGNTVTVNKYTCPAWVNPETDTLLEACAPGGDGVGFALVDGNGTHPAAVSGGAITWTDVVIGGEGELQIIEDIPAGYGDPWVVCDGILMASTNGFVVPVPGEARPFHIDCDWFNFAQEDAALAVVKHTCAAGYDLYAAGADPMADCPELTDGVDFRIAGMGTDMTSSTGDAGPGMVQFGGLDPGAYTLTETAPDGTAASFVLDCFGNTVGAVRPYPLATGDTLDLTIHAGEDITCHWFNVEAAEGGSLTVVKHRCAGDAWVSDVDCEIYEGGATFDLLVWHDGGWVTVDTLTTDDHGRTTFGNLAAGEWWLAERDGAWCHLASDRLRDDGAALTVTNGVETVVDVYNCGAEPGTPGETPTKYPDTGVPPGNPGVGGGQTLPVAALAGLLALPLSRRRLVALAMGLPVAGFAGTALAQEGEQVIEPIDGTAGPEVTPASLCLPGSHDGCERGPVPAGIRIERIAVDAPIEVLETVAGEMQQPTGAAAVAWYKETARLGETGNALLAGHLNWWGIPEAVFYRLSELRPGDEIRLLDGDGRAWRYTVAWMREEPAGTPPGADVLGMTAWPAVTLITCGGEWDAARGEYDARTVVRANQVEEGVVADGA